MNLIKLALLAFLLVSVSGQDQAFQLLRDAVDKGEIPGYIGLVKRKGKILRHEARGLRDIENNLPFTTNTSAGSPPSPSL